MTRSCIVAPELARLSSAASGLFGHCRESRTKHHELSCNGIMQHEKRIESLKSLMRENNPLDTDGPLLINLKFMCLYCNSVIDLIVGI